MEADVDILEYISSNDSRFDNQKSVLTADYFILVSNYPTGNLKGAYYTIADSTHFNL
jgi:hypothetical protein